jgi:hypothetical protein
MASSSSGHAVEMQQQQQQTAAAPAGSASSSQPEKMSTEALNKERIRRFVLLKMSMPELPLSDNPTKTVITNTLIIDAVCCMCSILSQPSIQIFPNGFYRWRTRCII